VSPVSQVQAWRERPGSDPAPSPGRTSAPAPPPALDRAEAAGLVAALDEIPSPAFVLWADGRIALANGPGEAATRRAPQGVASRLRASLAGHDEAFRVTPIRSPGAPSHFLVVQRRGTADPAPRVAAAMAHWGVTARQGQVLALLALGQANKAIAVALGCASSTVEIHVSALLAKSGCQSRSELVSRFWSEPIAQRQDRTAALPPALQSF
jgi:DNA-binding CsgD family transcriptional regulator